MDYETSIHDLSMVFKIANLFAGAIGTLCGLSQLFSGFRNFLLGLFVIFFSGLTVFLEIQKLPLVFDYCSFLYSFLGRGLFYILLGIIVCYGSIFRLLGGLLLILVGGVFLTLNFIPSVEVPESMQQHSGMIDDDLEQL